MKSLAVHTALLVAALVLAFVTWTSSSSPQADRNLVDVWNHEPGRLASVTWRSNAHTLTIERRERQAGTYLWAVDTMPAPVLPVADSEAPAPAAPPQVDEYPVGEDGGALLEQLARLQAVRDLGQPEEPDLAGYGLTSVTDTVKLRFGGGEQRALAVGGSVVGGGDRYVRDVATGRVYVLSAGLLQPLQVPGAFRLTQLQGFQPAAVRGAVLRAGGTERVMKRTAAAEPAQAVWTAAGSAQPDQAFANFMSQLDGLWVTQFRPNVDVDSLQLIVQVDYLGARSDTLGTFQLYRTASPDSATYFLRTMATIVPGEAYGPVAERLEQDVHTLFSATPRPQ